MWGFVWHKFCNLNNWLHLASSQNTPRVQYHPWPRALTVSILVWGGRYGAHFKKLVNKLPSKLQTRKKQHTALMVICFLNFMFHYRNVNNSILLNIYPLLVNTESFPANLTVTSSRICITSASLNCALLESPKKTFFSPLKYVQAK